jgi:hypothetical protein
MGSERVLPHQKADINHISCTPAYYLGVELTLHHQLLDQQSDRSPVFKILCILIVLLVGIRQRRE